MARKPLTSLFLAVTFLCGSVVSGQSPPPRSQRGDPGERRPSMRGAPWQRNPSPGFPRPGGPDPRGRRGDRFSRLEGFLRTMDANRDGIIQQNEVPPERQGMYRMMSMRLGQDPSQGISIQKLRDTMARRRGPSRPDEARISSAGESPGKQDSSQSKPDQAQAEPLVPGFGTDREPAPVAGFGARTGPTGRIVLGTIDPEARAMLSRYDRNRNGVLDRDEWGGLRGNPHELDRNRDGKITLAELASDALQRQRRSSRNQRDSYARPNHDRDGNEKQDDSTAKRNKRRSYRFLSAHERLPKGLPGWFVARDADLDGQVTMAEFARNWNDSTFMEYLTYDANNDGMITPKECLRAAGAKADAKTDGTERASPPSNSPGGGQSRPWWLQ